MSNSLPLSRRSPQIRCAEYLRQAFVEERLELRQMLRHEPGRGRGRRWAPRVAWALRLASHLPEHPLEVGLDEAPGPHVLGLLLAPDDLGLLEARQLLQQRLRRERIELLDPEQVDVVDPTLLALVVEIIIDLAGAEYDAADLVVLRKLDLLTFVR